MSMQKLSRDRVLGLSAIVFGLVVFLAGSRLEPMIALNEPGPKLFPMIAGGGMLICGALMAFRKKNKQYKPFMDKAGFIRMCQLFLILVAYVFIGLEYVGYLISTPVLLIVLYYVLAEKDKRPPLWHCILMGLGIGLALYFFFTSMKISLPKGVILKLFGLKW